MNANTIPAASLIEKIHAARRALRDRSQASRAEEITKSFALVRAEQWIEDHKAVDTGFVVRVINVIANSDNILDVERAEIRAYLFSVLLGTAPDGICYRRADSPAHYLNAAPAADWIAHAEMNGTIGDETPHEVTRAEARAIFDRAVADGTLVAMSEAEAAEANQLYQDVEIPSMVMSRVDWIEAVWETEDLNGDEQAAADFVAKGIADGRLVPVAEMPKTDWE